MLPLDVHQLCEVVKGTIVSQAPASIVTGLVVDSQKTQPGDIFVAFVGKSVDGHRFVPESVNRGATAILVTHEFPTLTSPCTVIQIDDPLNAIHRLTRFERSRFAGPVLGVTGSNGKTTTKEMLALVFGNLGPCLHTEGNMNTELGLPLTMLRHQSEHQSMVLEMGMRGLGQIAELCSLATPTSGIITNIGQSHMELLGSQANIAKAKAELIESLPSSGYAALPANDEWVRQVSDRTSAQILWYDIVDDPSAISNQHLFATAFNVRVTERGLHFTVRIQDQEASVDLPTYGRHNVRNALGAMALGAAHQIPLVDMAKALESLSIGSGRLHMVRGERGITVIDDCYNASPLSMKASLDVLMDVVRPGGHAIAIVGDMYELGPIAESGHREVGAYAAKRGIPLIAVGPMSKWVAEEASKAGGTVHHFETREEAVAALPGVVPDDAMVLVKASRGMGLEQVVQALMNG